MNSILIWHENRYGAKQCLFVFLTLMTLGLSQSLARSSKAEAATSTLVSVSDFNEMRQAFLNDINKLREHDVPFWKRHFWKIIAIVVAVVIITTSIVGVFIPTPDLSAAPHIVVPARCIILGGGIFAAVYIGKWIALIAFTSALIGGSYVAKPLQKDIILTKPTKEDIVAIEQRIDKNRDQIIARSKTRKDIEQQFNKIAREVLKEPR